LGAADAAAVADHGDVHGADVLGRSRGLQDMLRLLGAILGSDDAEPCADTLLSSLLLGCLRFLAVRIVGAPQVPYLPGMPSVYDCEALAKDTSLQCQQYGDARLTRTLIT